MGLFSRKSSIPALKKLGKGKQLEKRVAGDVADEYEESDSADVPTSDYVQEFKEGIDGIRELFMSDDESGGDKFAKFSFGLAELCNYHAVVFDGFVGGGMSDRKANANIRDILVEAGFVDMMMEIVSFRETKKKRGRKKKVN